MKTGLFIKIALITVLFLLILPSIALAAVPLPGADLTKTITTTVPAIELGIVKPAMPSDLTATILSPTAIRLNWKDNSNNETGFTIGVHGGGYNMGHGVAANSVQEILDYLHPGWPYDFQIIASNSAGNSGWSSKIYIDLTVPKAPTNLTAVSTTVNTIQLTWSDNALNEDLFKIERQSAGGSFSQIGTTARDITSYADSSLLPGTVYTYRIIASNPVGDSAFSGNASYTTAPLAPSPTPQSTPTPAPQSTPSPQQQPGSVDYSTASNWAVPEIKEAIQYNLVTDKLLSNFQQKITREEFCEIVVRLYEAVSGKKALPIITNPFNDTVNVEVLKAYNLGIVKGVSNVSFGPDNLISRQEICVMIFRALKAADPGVSAITTGVDKFTDEKSIASWAINEVRFASKNGIMKGTNGNKIAPLEKVTREQAIVLLKRTYDSFK